MKLISPSPAQLLCSALLPLLVLTTGCETPVNPPPTASATTSPTNFAELKEGLTAQEVRQLVGEPLSTRPFVSNGIQSTIWHYEHTLKETVEQVPISTREVPLMNPLTGVMGSTQESVFANEHRKLIESVDVLLLGDKVISLKRTSHVEKQLVN